MNPFSFEATYASAWREFRRRRLAVWISSAGAVALIVSAVVYVKLTGRRADGIAMVMLPWWLAHGVVGFRYSLWKCPRCSRSFHMKFPRGNARAKECMHCGLPKWADGPGPTRRRRVSEAGTERRSTPASQR